MGGPVSVSPLFILQLEHEKTLQITTKLSEKYNSGNGEALLPLYKNATKFILMASLVVPTISQACHTKCDTWGSNLQRWHY